MKKFFAKVMLSTIFLFLSLLAVVIASGMTFGQRCEKMGYKQDTTEWKICLHSLSKGIEVQSFSK